MSFKLLFKFLLTISILLCSSPTFASTKIQPNEVYSLWYNINIALIIVERHMDGTVHDHKENIVDYSKIVNPLKNKNIKIYTEKKPSDVYKYVSLFREDLNVFINSYNLPNIKSYPPRSDIKPVDVFMNSGFILDSLVEWIIQHVNENILTSSLYKKIPFTNKTPNDVYGLVELAQGHFEKIKVKQKK